MLQLSTAAVRLDEQLLLNSHVSTRPPKLGCFEDFCFVTLTVDAGWCMETQCDRHSEQENADFSVSSNGSGVVTVFNEYTG